MNEPSEAMASAQRWAHEQGYHLEYTTARAFRAAGFRATQGRTYRDPVTGRIREIDVTALALIGDTTSDLLCIVECKATKVPWIVLTGTLSVEDATWVPIVSKPLANAFLRRTPLLRQAFPIDGPTGYSVVQAHSRAEPNPAYSALSQVVDACVGVARQRETSRVLCYPVVVIDSPLFALTYTHTGEESWSTRDWQRVVWSGSEHWDAPVAIDVVSSAVVEEHAKELLSGMLRLRAG